MVYGVEILGQNEICVSSVIKKDTFKLCVFMVLVINGQETCANIYMNSECLTETFHCWL